MADRKMVLIECPACQKTTPVKGTVAGERMEVACMRCGYVMNLSVRHIKRAYGAREFVDGAWWV